MISVRALLRTTGLLTLALVAGCSGTRFGKCKGDDMGVYPAQPCYECSQGTTYDAMPMPAMQPIPTPPGQGMPAPVPPMEDPSVPPPPTEGAVRARPIREVSETTRDAYRSMSNNVRAFFTR